MNKKVMILGTGYFQITVIKAAKRLNCYVIGCDMVKDLPGEKYVDKFYEVSTTDRPKILDIAQKESIDGILTFASDVSASTVAFVADKMRLRGNSLLTIEIMTDKNKFHPFLRSHGFIVPESTTVQSIEDVYDFFDRIDGAIMLKPIGSSGSRGISKILKREDIRKAYDEANKYRRTGECLVVEKFLKRDGYQIAGDAFVDEGKIVYFGLGDEHFDDNGNGLVPIGESFPSSIDESRRIKAKNEIERALNCLGYNYGAVNLDFMFDKNDNVIILELGPRNGGNLITDAIMESCGVDLGEMTVKSALGETITVNAEKKARYISSYLWHSLQDGIFESIEIKEEIKKRILSSMIFVNKGDIVKEFINGSCFLGIALLEFDSIEQMLKMLDNMNDYYSIKLRCE